MSKPNILKQTLSFSYILVPQVGQVLLVAGLLFFIVIALAPLISLLVRHLMQYPFIQLPPFCYNQVVITSWVSHYVR